MAEKSLVNEDADKDPPVVVAPVAVVALVVDDELAELLPQAASATVASATAAITQTRPKDGLMLISPLSASSAAVHHAT